MISYFIIRSCLCSLSDWHAALFVYYWWFDDNSICRIFLISLFYLSMIHLRNHLNNLGWAFATSIQQSTVINMWRSTANVTFQLSNKIYTLVGDGSRIDILHVLVDTFQLWTNQYTMGKVEVRSPTMNVHEYYQCFYCPAKMDQNKDRTVGLLIWSVILNNMVWNGYHVGCQKDDFVVFEPHYYEY